MKEINDLENFVEKNRDLFDNEELPAGHQERFLKKLEAVRAEEKAAEQVAGAVHNGNRLQDILNTVGNWFAETARRFTTRKALLYFATPSVAIAAICLFFILKENNVERIKLVSPQGVTNVAAMENIYLKQVKNYGNILINSSSNAGDATQAQVKSVVSALTEDAIPMSEQIPSELSKNEQFKILKEYYNQKMAGLKNIKVFIAQNDPEENNFKFWK
ncbi:MAG TPA: hypothetical protein PK500_06260 [Candidatus Egerieousia sp.]|nr:hypothetical protein [Candidatus Egerieousia sp.]HPT06237.1 hypothetical protein [Candidatus Egerieousia sp.]